MLFLVVFLFESASPLVLLVTPEISSLSFSFRQIVVIVLISGKFCRCSASPYSLVFVVVLGCVNEVEADVCVVSGNDLFKMAALYRDGLMFALIGC